jgi:hypothetical protein
MDRQAESTIFADWVHSLEPWVLPAIAVVLVGGMVFLATIGGLIWLAARPIRQPTVIWMRPVAGQAVEQNQPPAAHGNFQLENSRNVRAN